MTRFRQPTGRALGGTVDATCLTQGLRWVQDRLRSLCTCTDDSRCPVCVVHQNLAEATADLEGEIESLWQDHDLAQCLAQAVAAQVTLEHVHGPQPSGWRNPRGQLMTALLAWAEDRWTSSHRHACREPIHGYEEPHDMLASGALDDVTIWCPRCKRAHGPTCETPPP